MDGDFIRFLWNLIQVERSSYCGLCHSVRIWYHHRIVAFATRSERIFISACGWSQRGREAVDKPGGLVTEAALCS